MHDAHPSSIEALITLTRQVYFTSDDELIKIEFYKPQWVLLIAIYCSLQTHRNALPPIRLQLEFEVAHVPGIQKSPRLCWDWTVAERDNTQLNRQIICSNKPRRLASIRVKQQRLAINSREDNFNIFEYRWQCRCSCWKMWSTFVLLPYR